MDSAVRWLKCAARLLVKGNHYEDFELGRRFDHRWGRTVGESDSTIFTTLTLHYNPTYFNLLHAQAQGHPRLPVNPFLAFAVVFGLSVEDLSEGGGAFLGVDELNFRHPVYVNDTLTATSTVVRRRLSEKARGFGIVTWRTQGMNQDAICVLDFLRTNLVKARS